MVLPDYVHRTGVDDDWRIDFAQALLFVGREARLNDLILGAALLTALACGGCGGMTPGQYPNFWTQCVRADAWGISYVSPYGPVNIGRVIWTRNVQCSAEEANAAAASGPQPPD